VLDLVSAAARPEGVLCGMAKKEEAVDNLLDALVWMRRKAKKHEPVDVLIDALVKMRRRAKKNVVKKKTGKKKTRKQAKG
jgi:ClpP class serine protease